MMFNEHDRIKIVTKDPDVKDYIGKCGYIASIGLYRWKSVHGDSNQFDYGVRIDGEKELLGFNDDELDFE